MKKYAKILRDIVIAVIVCAGVHVIKKILFPNPDQAPELIRFIYAFIIIEIVRDYFESRTEY